MSPAARDWDPGPSLRKHLLSLAGERSPLGSPDSLRRAEAYVEASLREAGLDTFREPIASSGNAWHNVVADWKGDSRSPLFVIGAHVDTVEGTPGADDNASGVAALLSLAEWLGEGGKPAGGTPLRLAAFNLEEWGMVGSSEHAEALRAGGRDVSGMVALEMIGYADASPRSQRYPPGMAFGRRRTGDFISVVGNTASRSLVQRVASALRLDGALPVETAVLPGAAAMLIGASLSDHSSFWRCGFRAVMVGDTAFYRNPHYHRSSDTVETLSLPFLGKVTQGLAVLVESLL